MSLSNSLLCRMIVVFLLFCLSKASGGRGLSKASKQRLVTELRPKSTGTVSGNFGRNVIRIIPEKEVEIGNDYTSTCLSYGHSCWGGHGKRSGNSHIIGPFSRKHASGWFISKLLDSPIGDSKNFDEIFKNQNLDSEEVENFNRSGYQVYPEPDTEKHNVRPEKGNLEIGSTQKKWNSKADESEEEIIVLTPTIQREPISKFRLYQIMSKDSNNPRKEF